LKQLHPLSDTTDQVETRVVNLSNKNPFLLYNQRETNSILFRNTPKVDAWLLLLKRRGYPQASIWNDNLLLKTTS